MAIAADTFVEATDTDILSHTPTGPNAGAGWELGAASGSAIIDATDDKVIDTNGSNGNRFRMTTNLGSAQMDVQGDFTKIDTALRFNGFLIRITASGLGAEFTHDQGRWIFYDGTSETTVTEDWPGGVVTMRAVIRTNNWVGKANGTTRITLASDVFNTQTYAGILLGNFTGTGSQIAMDNYYSEGFLGDPARIIIQKS